MYEMLYLSPAKRGRMLYERVTVLRSVIVENIRENRYHASPIRFVNSA